MVSNGPGRINQAFSVRSSTWPKSQLRADWAKFQSLRATVQHACSRASAMDIARQDLDQFLAGHPVDGSIKVWLEVSPEWLDDYNDVRRRITEISGKPVQDKAVIPFVVHLAQVRGVF